MNQPHDTWAAFFDFVYDRTYGHVYAGATEKTLQVINEIKPTGSLIDYGAGTGRLAIPLKQQGYSVIAVEKSTRMADEFNAKCLSHNLDIPMHACSIAEYGNGKADMAMALFTVLSYLLTDDELEESIGVISQHINPGGLFLFDLPGMVFFNTGRLINHQSSELQRLVDINSTSENDIYIYRETCSGRFNGKAFSYKDEFRIRYWPLTIVEKLLNKYDLKNTQKCFPQLAFTGSAYHLFQKQS